VAGEWRAYVGVGARARQDAGVRVAPLAPHGASRCAPGSRDRLPLDGSSQVVASGAELRGSTSGPFMQSSPRRGRPWPVPRRLAPVEIAGYPSANRLFVFNGDYVDRGAWGFETYFYLLAWKLFLPHRVFLLRGNHETKFCTSAYGFEQEIMSKFGERAKHLYRKLLGCFEGHPLAARVAGCVYMAHGGLFRQVEKEPPKKTKGKSYRRLLSGRNSEKPLKLGTLDDLAKARRMVLDPSGFGTNVIPGDVLWSDPSPENGLSHNDSRGIGLLFGPDCTQEFMEKHKLKLIVRSHEGPDARDKRPEMEAMNKGYTVDHVVKAGKLITLFSAPDYPQFQASADRYNNKGAYIVLEAPDFSVPHFFEFEAVLPRPKVSPYYDFVNSIDSDEELDLGSGSGSEGSAGSGSDKES